MGEEDGPIYVPSKGWAEMIRKVYEVDPLRCPTCGGHLPVNLSSPKGSLNLDAETYPV